jgi:2'-5' RNA ligase
MTDEGFSRLFFALWPDETTREAIVGAVRPLQSRIRGRWVARQNLHITLIFLGFVPSERVAELELLPRRLGGAGGELILDRLEFWRRSRVLCLGASAPPPALLDLVAKLQDELTRAGYTLEQRPFRAHATLARKVDVKWSMKPLPTPVVWSLDGIVLVESKLTPEGPVYDLRGRGE